MGRLAALAVVPALVVGGGAVGARLEHVHDVTGQWRLIVSSATPARISALGRSYDRSGRSARTSVPSGLASAGETPAGGTILVPVGETGTPLVIYVRDREGLIWTYGLVGGP